MVSDRLCVPSLISISFHTLGTRMFALRRSQTMHSLVLLGGIILCLVLMIQVKQIYENNQKHNRYLGYEQYLKEISDEMSLVERSANKSSAYIRILNDALLKHRERETKNVSAL